MDRRIIPSTLHTGFLESGKTRRIQLFLESEKINPLERILVLVLEEGIEEYDISRFTSRYVFLKYVGGPHEPNWDTLSAFALEQRVNRIVIECNGMWRMDTIVGALPKTWSQVETVTHIDSSTFTLYQKNLLSLLCDKLRYSDSVIFNRVSVRFDKKTAFNAVRQLNSKACVYFEASDGSLVLYESPVRHGIPVDNTGIELDDTNFTALSRDIFENPDGYDGRNVRLTGQVPTGMPVQEDFFVLGRYVMFCCMDDLAFSGFVCTRRNASPPAAGDWLSISARISVRYHEWYKRRGPVLTILTAEKAPPPLQAIVLP